MGVPVSLVLVAHHPPLLPAEEREGRLLNRFCDTMIAGFLPMMTLVHHALCPVTVAISQPLLEMLDRPRLRDAVEARLEEAIRWATEASLTYAGSAVAAIAQGDVARFETLLATYRDVYERDLSQVLATWCAEGRVGLIPVAGSHALLPLLRTRAIRGLHINAALQAFTERFDTQPQGIWLPECAVDPEVLDAFVACRPGVSVVSGHALDGSRAVVLGDKATLLARHSACQLWSGAAAGTRAPSREGQQTPSLWSWYAHNGAERVSARSIYDAAVGRAQAETLAQATLEALSPDSPGVLAWDVAELAHTWFEWTEAWTALVRVSRETEGLEWVTLDRLAEREEQQVPSTGTAPVSGLRAISTWHPDVLSPWLAPANSWLLRHMHRLEQRLLNAVDGRHLNTQHELPPWQRRAIIVALRELLMLQSSDLAAAMVASSGVGHALERTQGHIKRAQRLLDMVERDAVDGRFIETLEQDTTLAALADPSHMLRG